MSKKSYTEGKSFFKWAFSEKKHKRYLIFSTLLGLLFVISPIATRDDFDALWIPYVISSFFMFIWIPLNWFRVWNIYRKLKKMDANDNV